MDRKASYYRVFVTNALDVKSRCYSRRPSSELGYRSDSLGFPLPCLHLKSAHDRIVKYWVRIKVVLLLVALLATAGCASNSARTEGNGKPSGMPEVSVDAPEKRVKATIHF